MFFLLSRFLVLNTCLLGITKRRTWFYSGLEISTNKQRVVMLAESLVAGHKIFLLVKIGLPQI
jgi:hypothetical protein